MMYTRMWDQHIATTSFDLIIHSFLDQKVKECLLTVDNKPFGMYSIVCML